nr:PREDICTED: homeobox-leucine zipper protein HAT5-like [Nicotiana tabacum]
MNSFILPNESFPLPSKVLDSLWISNSSPTFHGSVSMVNFDDTRGTKTKERSFFPSLDKEENTNEDYEVSFHQPEKKRRLLPKQVQFLEKSFEVENKLEPERKIQLAKETGLQPRQVAIWFQNRRARYKSKQLEKDYDVLKASFDKLKDEYDSLFKENDNLRNEVHLLKEKLFNREQNSEEKEPISPLNTEAQNPTNNMQNLTMMVCKQEDASSAKSDILDSDSPCYADGNYTSFLEPSDSSHAFETETSDFSQEDDSLSRTLLSSLCFPKLEDDLPVNSCHLSFQIEDQSWFCHY